MLEGMAMGATVLVIKEDVMRDSSIPSRYILIDVLCGFFRVLRLVNVGMVFVTRPWPTFIADVVIRQTTADRFMIMFFYFDFTSFIWNNENDLFRDEDGRRSEIILCLDVWKTIVLWRGNQESALERCYGRCRMSKRSREVLAA
jgi:hypothetical protein